MSKEQAVPHELDPALIAGYMATFINRTDVFPMQRDDGRYLSVKRPLTANTVVSHLLGQLTMGAYALSPLSEAKWICFDADDDDHWQTLQTFASALDALHVSTYREQSRRGGHVWLFFAPRSGREARRFGKQLLTEYTLTGIELYPKQDALRTGPGSLVRLPLGIHRKTGKRYCFMTQTGAPLASSIRGQLALLARPERVAPPFIDEVLARAPEPHSVVSSPPFHREPFPKTVGQPSGENLSDRIKATVSVLDFVSRYVPLDDHGFGHCPFHDDEHVSFGVSKDGNYWHCFAGCGGGSLIDFWMKWREKQGQDGSFTASVTELAQLLLKG